MKPPPQMSNPSLGGLDLATFGKAVGWWLRKDKFSKSYHPETFFGAIHSTSFASNSGTSWNFAGKSG